MLPVATETGTKGFGILPVATETATKGFGILPVATETATKHTLFFGIFLVLT
jgi:hypothetical protein